MAPFFAVCGEFHIGRGINRVDTHFKEGGGCFGFAEAKDMERAAVDLSKHG